MEQEIATFKRSSALALSLVLATHKGTSTWFLRHAWLRNLCMCISPQMKFYQMRKTSDMVGVAA